MRSQFILSALLPLASAHFKLVYPAARGFDEDTLATFPCGGQNTVSSNRTMFPINGAPIQLNMGHTQTNLQVLLALGNDPGSNFNITLVPTFTEEGPQNFCIGAGAIQYPEGLNITDGMNATIQVVSNGDPSGGLYNCADITFTSTQLSQAEYNNDCKNSTGVSTHALSGAQVNANQTTESGSSSSASGSASVSASGSSASATSSAAASSASAGAASQATLAAWALGAMGVVAGVVAL
ncbi:hypothetical protein H2203_006080 [Taxawa tesnikishii (nom. ined.)]|nr:hypothetical protein H2203_006080 [Dothideales sp. JES 119]